VWFVTSHEDRYIQNLLPWMAASTTAFLVLAWRSGKIPVRAALLTLVLFQIVWGADLYFLRNHSMAGDSAVKVAIDRIAAGHAKRYKERLTFPGGMDVVTPALPKDAKVLIHNIRLSLGIGRPVVDDEHTWQLGIDYLSYKTPEETFATWRKMGVTHAVWVHHQAGGSYELVAREAAFAHALGVYGGNVTDIGGYQVTALSRKSAKGARAPTRVAWLGCGGDPPLGVYKLADSLKRKPERLFSTADLASDFKGQLADVPVAILRPACGSLGAVSSQLRASYKQMFTVGDVSIWARKN
jgi:hypothetical protein